MVEVLFWLWRLCYRLCKSEDVHEATAAGEDEYGDGGGGGQQAGAMEVEDLG